MVTTVGVGAGEDEAIPGGTEGSAWSYLNEQVEGRPAGWAARLSHAVNRYLLSDIGQRTVGHNRLQSAADVEFDDAAATSVRLVDRPTKFICSARIARAGHGEHHKRACRAIAQSEIEADHSKRDNGYRNKWPDKMLR